MFRAPGLVDLIGLRDQTPPPGTAPLLRQVMSAGRRAERLEPLDRARERCAADLADLSDGPRRVRDPSPLATGYTAELQHYARDTGAMASIDLTGKAADAEGRS